MKRKMISLLLAVSMAATPAFPAFAAEPISDEATVAYAEAKKDMPRVIITTDLEVDDINSVIHLALYSNEIDLIGWVVSSSQYHWNGDGNGTTLGEAVQSYRCQGKRIYADHFDSAVGTDFDPEAAELTRYRAIPMGWLEELWDNEYRAAYENLVKHDLNYPTPEYMLSITKYGNYEFEGDVRYETEGSNLIKDALLDDDMRPLYINSWGGVNTVVRALMSIAEEYQDTDEWDEVYKKVCTKARIRGNGQDNSWADNNIAEIYPDLVLIRGTSGYVSYGINDLYSPNAVDGDENYLWGTRGSAPDVNETFGGEWVGENLQENHGPFMARFHTFLDGQTISEEPMIYQLGLTGIHDMRPENWTPRLYDENDFIAIGDSGGILGYLDTGFEGITSEEMEYGRYGSGFGGAMTYSTASGTALTENRGIDSIVGRYTRGDTNGRDTRFLRAVQEDFAARADWCISEYENANHAPEINVDQKIIYAEPGEGVEFAATASDPDGDQVYTSWWIYPEGSAYSGEVSDLRVWRPGSRKTGFTVPWDAQEGDYFNLVIEGRDDDASAPMTRYSQVIVKVVNTTKVDAQMPVINTYPESGKVTDGAYTMNVEAQACADGGELSYQWYTYDAEVASAFYAIPDATEAFYTAEHTEPGEYYYYVTVTNTVEDNGDGGEKAVRTVSHIVTVTVPEE